MSTSKKQILIIQTAFIGDVILSTCLLEFFKAVYPDCVLDFVLRKSNASLLSEHPSIRNLITWDKSAPKVLSLRKVIKTIRKNRYDLVVNTHRYTSTGLMTLFAKAVSTVGYDKNPLSRLFSRRVVHRFEEGLHEVDRLHALVQHLDSRTFKPKLYLPQRVIEQVKVYQNGSYRVIAPQSVWFTKRYPADRWIDFLDNSTFTGHTYLVGGPADFDEVEHIRMSTKNDRVINLCGKLSLLASAALMQGAEMNYVNDSGPMHLCSAVNAPVKAIYCSTTPALGFGPLSDNREIVEYEGPLPCRPCGLHGKKTCPEGHFRCAYGIDPVKLEVS